MSAQNVVEEKPILMKSELPGQVLPSILIFKTGSLLPFRAVSVDSPNFTGVYAQVVQVMSLIF